MRGFYGIFSLFLAPASFRQLPRASVVPIFVGPSGTVTHSSDTEFLGKVASSGGLAYFFASVSFRGLPRESVVPMSVLASGTATRSSEAVFPGNKRPLWAHFLFFLDCVRFRGVQLRPYMLGLLVRRPQVKTPYFRKYSDSRRD